MIRPVPLRPALIGLVGLGLLAAAPQVQAAQQQNAAATTLSMLPVVTLKSSATVNGAEIRLGDLFDGAGAHAQDIVADAPVPGGTQQFDETWLTSTAAEHGLNWMPPNQFASIEVKRAATVIDNAEIAEQLAEKLTGGRPDRMVRLNSSIRLYEPVGAPTDIAVDNLDYNQATGQFQADLRVPANDPTAQLVHVSGMVESTVQVPTLSHPMRPGETITQDDIAWVTMVANQVPSDDVTDIGKIVGTQPRHPIQAGVPLQPYDVALPVLVHRYQMVLIVLQQPGLYMTAEGKAMDDGGKGEIIPVTNLQSNRTIDAVVIGDGQVGIPMPGMNNSVASAD